MNEQSHSFPVSRLPSAGFRRTAVVHDWLNGMRGGEKVLESILSLVPDPTIFTLFHVPGSVSPEIERYSVRTSWLNRLPFTRRRYRHYLPLFASAVESFDLSGFDLVASVFCLLLPSGIVLVDGNRAGHQERPDDEWMARAQGRPGFWTRLSRSRFRSVCAIRRRRHRSRSRRLRGFRFLQPPTYRNRYVRRSVAFRIS